MSWTALAMTVLTVLGLSVGQVLFKMAANRMHGGGTALWALLTNAPLWWALVVYGVSTIVWIAVLREVPLRLAYPFVASAFFIVPLLAHFFLGEPLQRQSMVGAALIALGILVATYGEVR